MNVKQVIKLIEGTEEYKGAVSAGLDVESLLKTGDVKWMTRSEQGVISKALATIKRSMTAQDKLADLEANGVEFSGVVIGSTDQYVYDPNKKHGRPPVFLMITEAGELHKFNIFGESPFAEHAPCKATVVCVEKVFTTKQGDEVRSWQTEEAGIISIEPVNGFELAKKLAASAISATDAKAIGEIYAEFAEGYAYETKILKGSIRYVNGSVKFVWDASKPDKYTGKYGAVNVDRDDKELEVITDGNPTFTLVLENEKSNVTVKAQLPRMRFGAITTCVADFDDIVDDASQLPTIKEQLKDVESGLFKRDVVIIGDVSRAEQYQTTDKKGNQMLVTGITLTPYGIFECGDTTKQQALPTEAKKSEKKASKPSKSSGNDKTIPELITAIAEYAESLGQTPDYFSEDEIRAALPDFVGSRDNTSIRTAINSAVRQAAGSA